MTSSVMNGGAEASIGANARTQLLSIRMIKKFERLACIAFAFAVLLWSRPSHAYAWMIQHQYTGCAVCHVDPSGGYLLTAYGRAQTQALLSTFGKGPAGDEVDSRSHFAYGLMPPNDYVNLGAVLRAAYIKSSELQTRTLIMQADFRAALTVDRFIATGSVGYLQNGPHPAQVTPGQNNLLVSREYWLGLQLGEDRNTMIRAGRMYLPFGVRFIEHYFYIRSNTGTDINRYQQMGASVFHEGESYRLEIMAIAGNYQIAPDDFRQRGYSGYVEFSAMQGMQLGLSSMVLYSKLDPTTLKENASFGAHGPMLRWSPTEHLAILSELDLLHFSAARTLTQYGLAGIAQLDWEFTRGMHTIVTGEVYHRPELDDAQGLHFNQREWLSLAWFMYPHIDIRGDVFRQSESAGPGVRVNSWTALGILHASL